MKTIVLAVSILLMLTGYTLLILARRNRKSGAPRMPSFNPVHWFQPWNIPDRLTVKGQKLLWTANACIMSGVALGMLAMALKGFFE